MEFHEHRHCFLAETCSDCSAIVGTVLRNLRPLPNKMKTKQLTRETVMEMEIRRKVIEFREIERRWVEWVVSQPPLGPKTVGLRACVFQVPEPPAPMIPH